MNSDTKYPIVLHLQKDGKYLVYIPDFDIYTQGNDLDDSIFMAKDAITLMISDLEEERKLIPMPFSKTYEIQSDEQVKYIMI